jgi:hypothetical protein
VSSLEEVRQRFVAEMGAYIEPVKAAAGATGSLRDAAEEAGLAVKFFNDAMKKSRNDAEEARAAAEMLGLSLDRTSDIAKKARDRFLELGFAEREAAAGARKLAEAQLAADAAMSRAGRGGLIGKMLGIFPGGGPGGGLALAGGLAAGATLLPLILTEVSALAGGLVAAGAGIAAFAAVAAPSWQKLTQDISAAHNANQAFQESALNVDQAIKASAAVNKLYHASFTGLSAGLQEGVRLLGNTSVRWQDLSKAQQGDVIALANNKAALKNLLPDQKTALSNLVAAKKAWDDMNPAQQQAATSLDKVGKAWQGIVAALQPSVLKILNDGLKVVNPLILDLGAFAGAAVKPIDGLLKQLGHFVVSPGFKDWLNQLMKLEGPSITAIGHGIGNIATNLGKFVTALPPADVVNGLNIAFRIVSGTLHALTFVVERSRHNFDELTGGIVAGWHNVRQWTLDAWHIIDQVFHNIDHAYQNVGHAADNFDRAVSFVTHHVEQYARDIQNAITGMKDRVGADIGALITRVEHDWDTGWHNVISFTSRIPGDILHALGDLGSLLIHEGEALISGLISGIESAIPGLSSAIGGIRSLMGGASSLGGSGIPSGLGSAATGALGGHGPHNAGMAAVVVQHALSVRVDVGGAVMTSPAAQQALARHMQAAVLDFAQANSGSMLVLPGRGA